MAACAAAVVFPSLSRMEAKKQEIEMRLENDRFREASSMAKRLNDWEQRLIGEELTEKSRTCVAQYLNGLTYEDAMKEETMDKAREIKSCLSDLGLEPLGKEAKSLDLLLKLEDYASYQPMLNVVASQELEEYLRETNVISLLEMSFRSARTDPIDEAIEAISAISFASYGLQEHGVAELEQSRLDSLQSLEVIRDACASQNVAQMQLGLAYLQEAMADGMNVAGEAQDILERAQSDYLTFCQSLS